MRHGAKTMSWLGAIALASAITLNVGAQQAGFYDQPDIADGKIVFVSDGDLWVVPESGGNAGRLTSAAGEEYMPRFSPDGKWIAYTGNYGGNRDVYVISVGGGEPRRLSWHPWRDEPVAWTPDGKHILYQTARESAHTSRQIWKVPVEGGVPEMVPVGVACFLDMAPDGDTVAFNRNYTQVRTWKRYGGGTADDIWMGSLTKQDFKKVTNYFGNDESPSFAGDRVYFRSERDGRMNLWSLDLRGRDLQQHTKLTDFDIANVQADGKGKVVFQHGADVMVYDAASKQAVKVPITIQSDFPGRQDRVVSPTSNVQSASISNDGKKILMTVRGNVYNVPVNSGRAITLTSGSEARDRDATFLGDEDQYVLYVSDKNGDEQLYRADARTGENETQVTRDGDGRRGRYFYSIAAANKSDNIVFGDETGAMYMSNTTTQTLELVDSSGIWEITEYDWSPDGNYIAYTKYNAGWKGQIFVYDVREKAIHPVTEDMYSSGSPSWDPEGKYLFFLSDRTFNPWNDRVDYETIMAPMTKPYGIALRADVKNPFLDTDPYEEDDVKKAKEEKEKEEAKDEGKEEKNGKKSSAPSDKLDEEEDEEGDDGEFVEGDGEEAKEEEEEDSSDEKKEDEEKLDLKIEFDGIAARIFEFPVNPGDIGGLLAVKSRIIYSRNPPHGRAEGSYWVDDAPSSSVHFFDWSDRENKESHLASGIGGYGLSANREHIIYFRGGVPHVAAASAGKLSAEDKAANTGNITVQVSPREEWKQIIEEAYRLNRDFYYMADMTGIKWREVADRYKTLVDRISNRAELNVILGHLIGELGAGHTYVWGGGDLAGLGFSPVYNGILGCDFEADRASNRIKLTKIMRGHRWNDSWHGPLDRDGVDIKDGDYLLKVDGKEVFADRDPLAHFVGKAGKDVLLTVNDKPVLEGARTYRIVPTSDDSAMRYRMWVEGRRQYVSEQSDGQIGYIHIPDMDADGLISFYRDYYPQIRKKAMVVDVRYNGGGNVSQLLIQRLTRIVLAIDSMRYFNEYNGTYPSTVFTGPLACVTNEGAGSDGDIFTYMFKRTKLGPVFGTRTWGGVVGIRGGKNFVDGGAITVPEFASFYEDMGWDLENYGVDPDVEVQMLPQDYVANRDPQLDKAIEYLKTEMKKDKYKTYEPDMKKTPKRDEDYFRKRSKDFMDKP